MKAKLWIGLMAVLMAGAVRAQSFDVEQLLLDVEKLSQLKQILQDLRDGYQVLDAGYSAIRDIAQGSFNLHKAFLDGLLAVSPAVRSYPRIADIANLQINMVNRYQTAWSWFRQKSGFRPEEITLIGQVYSQLLAASLQDLSDLTNLLTDGTMRASDAERMREIDKIYAGMVEKAAFLDRVSNSGALLALQQQSLLDEDQTLRQLYGIKP
jgi:hypothetical protein